MLRAGSFSLWIDLVTTTDSDIGEDAKDAALVYFSLFQYELMHAKDNAGRKIIGLASPIIKQAIEGLSLWFNRYRVDSGPDHTSDTCSVFHGIDELDVDIEGKGKKAVEQVLEIPFAAIKQTKVLIKF
jgi:hypothetical protein